MANPLPSSLALTTINDGTEIIASTHRNNYSAIQSAVNLLRACLAGGTAGQFLQAVDGTDVQYANAPGSEIGYDQITAPVSVTATTQGGAQTVIAGSSHVFDGSPVMAEIFTPAIIMPSVSGSTFDIALFEGGTILGVMCTLINTANTTWDTPVCLRYRFTPSAGSHTYSAKAYVSTTTGTPQFYAGTSGIANTPAYLRFTKV